MNIPKLTELLAETVREFTATLGNEYRVISQEIFGESHYRGGFRLTLSNERNKYEVLYSDMQFEVSFNGAEVFGVNVHGGFEGNMFSREHLREYLPRIAASSAGAERVSHAQG